MPLSFVGPQEQFKRVCSVCKTFKCKGRSKQLTTSYLTIAQTERKRGGGSRPEDTHRNPPNNLEYAFQCWVRGSINRFGFSISINRNQSNLVFGFNPFTFLKSFKFNPGFNWSIPRSLSNRLMEIVDRSSILGVAGCRNAYPRFEKDLLARFSKCSMAPPCRVLETVEGKVQF